MELVNKVAESGIVTFDLAPYLPDEESLVFFDLKPFLFREMILKEKDFREAMKQYDWTSFDQKQVALGCTADAVIPVWAYMLVATYLKDHATAVFFGTKEAFYDHLIAQQFQQLDLLPFHDQRVVLKGCGDKFVPTAAYVAASERLLPVVKSLMYGEPCSTVPVYKRRP